MFREPAGRGSDCHPVTCIASGASGGGAGGRGGILEAPACCHNTNASPKHISPLWDAERLRFLESLSDEQSIHANLIKERRGRSQVSSNPEKSFQGDQNFSVHLLSIYFDWPSRHGVRVPSPQTFNRGAPATWRGFSPIFWGG